jgi:hypothetical protein
LIPTKPGFVNKHIKMSGPPNMTAMIAEALAKAYGASKNGRLPVLTQPERAEFDVTSTFHKPKL